MRLLFLALLTACATPAPDTGGDDTGTPLTPFEWPDGWLPEVTHHPRLHPADRAAVQARVDREPYATLLARVRATAARAPIEVHDRDDLYAPWAYANGDIARAAAFLAWLDDDGDMRDKSVAILLDIRTDADAITAWDDDIHLADACVAYATAFDLLLGVGISDDDAAAIRANLEALAGSFYDVFAVRHPEIHRFGRSNHATKTAAAVGMLALVVNDHPDAYRWMAYAVTQLDYLARDMTSYDGVVDEGPFYHLYSAQTHLPFYLAYGDLAGGPLPYPPACDLRDEVDCDGDVATEYAPPLEWDLTAAQHDWGVRTRLPDGTRPPVDDAFQVPYYGGLLDDPLYRWDWTHSPTQPWFSDWTVDLSAELILRYDDTAAVAAPDWTPTQFLLDSGAAALRSGWDTDATMLFVTAESGNLRETGHEQEDEASFMLYAEGTTLALDPGYIRWADRDRVAHTEHHNLVLVDGLGSPEGTGLAAGGVDGWLQHGIDSADLDYVEANTRYRSTDLHRRLALVDDDWVVVADSVEGTRHTYTWMLHGWGGGSDGGTADLHPDGAAWTRAGARLDAHLVTDAPTAFAFTPSEHGLAYGDAQTHQRLDAVAEASTWTVLAVLKPSSAEAARAASTALDLGPDAVGIALDTGASSRDVVVFAPSGASVVVPPDGVCAGFSATGELIVARQDCAAGTVRIDAVADGALLP